MLGSSWSDANELNTIAHVTSNVLRSDNKRGYQDRCACSIHFRLSQTPHTEKVVAEFQEIKYGGGALK